MTLYSQAMLSAFALSSSSFSSSSSPSPFDSLPSLLAMQGNNTHHHHPSPTPTPPNPHLYPSPQMAQVVGASPKRVGGLVKDEEGEGGQGAERVDLRPARGWAGRGGVGERVTGSRQGGVGGEVGGISRWAWQGEAQGEEGEGVQEAMMGWTVEG